MAYTRAARDAMGDGQAWEIFIRFKWTPGKIGRIKWMIFGHTW